MKKIAAIMLTFALMIGTLAGCSSKSASEAGGDNSNGQKKLKVALVYAGFLGDKSFNG